MAEVVNSTNGSVSTMSGVTSETADSVLLSPAIKEAMDLIFPRSPAQLLEGEPLFEGERSFPSEERVSPGEDICSSYPSEDRVVCENRYHFGNSSSLQPNLFFDNDSTYPTAAASKMCNTTSSIHTISNCDVSVSCSVSTTDMITTTTTNTVMAAAFGVNTSNSGSSSPIVSTPPVIIATHNDHRKTGSEATSKSTSEFTKKLSSGSCISKADLGIISSFDIQGVDSQRKANSVDLSCSEKDSKDGSDSEDMSRPFASVVREKKKRKKKKKEDVDSSAYVNESEEIAMPDLSRFPPSGADCITLMKNDAGRITMYKQASLPESIVPCDGLKKGESQEQELASHHCSSSQDWILENGTLPDKDCRKNDEITSEEISNASFSSAKEEPIREPIRVLQKLPNVKSKYFHIKNDKKKINSSFLPCFVVSERVSSPCSNNAITVPATLDTALPLSARLKYLTLLCKLGSLSCRKRRRKKNLTEAEEFIYKNIFEENVLLGNSEDEFEIPRARSLRKRDKHISYVEPSEDDILDEFSRKRSRSKHKNQSNEEEADDAKRRKLAHPDSQSNSACPASSLNSSSDVNTSKNTTSGTASTTNKTKRASKPTTKSKSSPKASGPQEVVVYPPSNATILKPPSRYSSEFFPSANTTSTVTQAAMVSTATSNISVLATSLPAGAMRYPHPVFSSPQLNFPINLPPPPPLMAAMANSTAGLAAAGKNGQFCVVKIGGRDVLLQLMAPGGMAPGVPILTPGVPGLTPRGKTMLVPTSLPLMGAPSPLTSQAFSQSIPVSNPLLASSAPQLAFLPGSQKIVYSKPHNANFLSTDMLQNRRLGAGPPNITVSGLAMAPAVCNLPILTPAPGCQVASTSSTMLVSPAPAGVMTVAGSSISQATTSAVTVSTSTLPTVPVIASGAPGSQLPVTNLRTIVPNQTNNLRSLRIFVPACTATGTPGHFATLGFSTGSPLTHMSANSTFLPQRKESSQDLTQEQRAARRRKLELKYPLPPGVVIKTEPLDSLPPSTTASSNGTRSLLPQNIQVVASPRAGGNSSNIRIINSAGGALSASSLSGNSNIIYRAATLSDGQTVLVPTTLGLLSSSQSSTSVTRSSSLQSNGSGLILVKTPTPATSLSAAASSSGLTPSVTGVSAPGSQGLGTAVTAAGGQTCELVGLAQSTATVTVSDRSSAESPSVSSLSVNTPPRSASNTPQPTAQLITLEQMRAAVEDLRKMISVQESRGLQGDRLEKLKEVLRRKEESLLELERQSCGLNCSESLPFLNGDSEQLEEMGEDREVGGHVGSEMDPFVID